ncbi:hypothetical protein C8R47DRAFT_1089628 [Mycena vitilis]|nr:hypothetical protein C8R47DRAFT_1089628 [Mycena vitilis]
MSGGVHDGVTVRHVSCSVHDCTEAVISQRDLFCYTHRDLAKVCCIRGCEAAAHPGFKTCSDDAHRAFQLAAEEKNTAMFQLRSRLRQAGLSQAPMAGSTDPLDVDPDAPEDVAAAAAAAAVDPDAPPRLKGRLYRNWTVRCDNFTPKSETQPVGRKYHLLSSKLCYSPRSGTCEPSALLPVCSSAWTKELSLTAESSQKKCGIA